MNVDLTIKFEHLLVNVCVVIHGGCVSDKVVHVHTTTPPHGYILYLAVIKDGL